MKRSPRSLDVRAEARLYKALGDETRLRVVALLSHGELCVCHLHEALGVSQPFISRHLAILRSAGVVEDRRDRKWVYYRLARQPSIDGERSLRTIVRAFGARAALRADVARLRRTRGPGACS